MIEGAPPPHIAFISHKFEKNDGQGRVNYEVVKAALDQGYRVTVVAMSCALEISTHANARFVKMGNPSLPTELLRNVVFAFQSASWLRRHRGQFDLTQANGFVTWEACDVVAAHFIHSAWARSKYYSFRSWKPYSLYQRLYTALNSRWEKTAFTRARTVIAVSRLLVPDLVALGVKPDKIVVILNGVDIEQFRPGESVRSTFQLPADVPMALFVGDIRTPRKNLGAVLHAMTSVPEVHLAVAGGVKDSPFPELARSLGLESRVHFLDKVSRMPDLMRSVDFFVFPSRYEAHPLVLLEAMASGLPSIVSNTFGAEDFLGESGVILPDPEDVASLTSAMKLFINDPSNLQTLGQAARAQALGMSWTLMAGHYLDVYHELLDTKVPK